MTKKVILILQLFLLIIASANAQIPQSISYQAVVRDTSGGIISNQNVALRFSIRNTSPAGTILYSESHNALTNTYGLVTVNIGSGTMVSGSFASINWSTGTKFLQVEVDPNGGASFINMGTSQFLTVPYAFYSGSAGGSAGGDLTGSYPNPTVQRINGSLLGTTTSAVNGQVLKFNGSSWAPATDISNNGTVTSVALSMPAGFTVTNSPVTGSGTLTVGTTLNGPLRGNGSGITTGTTNLQTEVNNILRIVNGGTNSSTALSGSSIMISNGSSIVQGTAGTTTTVLHGNASGAPTYAPVSLTSDVSGVLPVGNLPSLAGDVTGAINASSVTKIRGTNVSATTPLNNQVLRYNSGASQWEAQTLAGSGWNLTGNSGTIDTVNYIGTNDPVSLSFRVNNEKAGKITYSTLGNVSFGYRSMEANIAYDNVAFGTYALNSSVSTMRNVAVGNNALFSNVAGHNNVAVGNYAQYHANNSSTNVSQNNVSVGAYALYGSAVPSANTGKNNTVVGNESMFFNSSGYENSAFGGGALYNNTIGFRNAAVGYGSLSGNTSGTMNAALGNGAMSANTSGHLNVAVGFQSLYSTTNREGNTCVGAGAGNIGALGNYNTLIGHFANQSVGSFVSNSIAIGYSTQITASDMVRVGNGVTSIGGPVGWTTTSDGRFKNNIREYQHGLDFILSLRPVTYNFSNAELNNYLGNEKALTSGELDKIVFSGFIAQEVEASAKKLGFEFSGVDAPKNSSDYYGLRYAEFVVPIIKAVQEQQKTITDLQQIIIELQKQNEELKTANQSMKSEFELIRQEIRSSDIGKN